MITKIKNFLLSIGQYIIIGIFCLGLIIFLLGFGVRGNRIINIYLIGIGLLILLPYLIYFLIFYINIKKEVSNKDHNIEELKEKGEKLLVNLEALKIKKTRVSYSSKIIHNTARTGALNQLIGNPDANIRTTRFSMNEINFKN